MTDKEIVYNSLIPELSVSNIDISKKFYLDLGFKIRYERKENHTDSAYFHDASYLYPDWIILWNYDIGQ